MKLRLIDRGRFQVYAICRQGGRCDLLDHLESAIPLENQDRKLSKEERDAVEMFHLLVSVAESGLPENNEKKRRLSDEVWELRKGKLRIPFFLDDGNLIICTHHFRKQSQRTPQKEIKRAENAKKRYMEDKRSGHNEIIEEED